MKIHLTYWNITKYFLFYNLHPTLIKIIKKRVKNMLTEMRKDDKIKTDENECK